VIARRPPRTGSYCVVALSRVLASMGTVPEAMEIKRPVQDKKLSPALTIGVPAEWCRLSRLWYDRATYSLKNRNKSYYFLLNVGRWLGKVHPEITSPADWTRALAAEAVSIVCQWHGGDWCSIDPVHVKSRGQILAPNTRAGRISILRVFFRDLQEWELIPRRFDPMRSMVTPKSLLALIGPNPRAIADDVWAKLMWAGLNLTVDDLPKKGDIRRVPFPSTAYPIEMTRALVITWLFAGLRRNEIVRLRVGCIRWQRDDVTVPGTGDSLPADAVCLLDVPVNKTTTAFTKPVDRIVGEAIAAWEKVRPQGAKLPDPKTGELVDFLFLIRLTRVGINYLNKTLIPALCKKAGVPLADVRGNITSHRARSTIASQLYNAREPMTLFELQEWLGHATPTATQHYAKITPLKVAKSYADAGYFARNLRAIEVLVDQDVVRSGRAATEPWKFYDLGHGYCTYDFFEQCQHRMACAKCDFYMPKESTAALLLEGKTHLLRLLQEIPLGEAEQAAVEDGVAAYENLLSNWQMCRLRLVQRRGRCEPDHDEPGHVLRIPTKEYDCQHEHEDWADEPVLHQRQAQHALVAEHFVEFFEADPRERRVHHQDQPRRDRHRSRADAEAVQERHDSGSKPAKSHAEHHGSEDPSRQIAIQKRQPTLFHHCLLRPADLVDFALDGHVLKRRQGQREEQPDPAVKHSEGITKRTGDLLWGSLDCRRIGNTPVRRHRLPRPVRTLLLRGVVAYSKNEVELRRFRPRELVP
jgi:integrase